MDTVEELNGTYFYAGKSNLNAAELLFMIFCENTASQFGIGAADFGAIIALISGRNSLGTRPKPVGAIIGTSYASIASRKVFKNSKFPFGISLPTWLGGYSPWTAKRVMVRNIGSFVGRSVPLVGMIILAADVSAVVYRTVRDYNMIARGERQNMVDDIEKRVYELIRPYAGTYLFNIRKVVLHPDADLDSDLNIDEPGAEELMDKFFIEFDVNRGNFYLKTYFPGIPFSFNPFKKPEPVPVPFFTIRMLIESAKAGKWLFD